MLDELAALLDLLKAKGVTHYEGPVVLPGSAPGNRVTVTFAPAVAEMPDEKDSVPLDMCRCGHHLAEHQGGACMHACDESKCVSE